MALFCKQNNRTSFKKAKTITVVIPIELPSKGKSNHSASSNGFSSLKDRQWQSQYQIPIELPTYSCKCNHSDRSNCVFFVISCVQTLDSVPDRWDLQIPIELPSKGKSNHSASSNGSSLSYHASKPWIRFQTTGTYRLAMIFC